MISEQLEKFVAYLRYEKRMSEHTIVAYKNDLNQFNQYLNAQYDQLALEDIKHAHLRSWLVDLKTSDHKERSIQRKVSSIKAFYKFLLKKNAVKTNPSAAIIAPKAPKRLPTFLEQNQSDTLFDLNQYPEGFEGLTHRLIIELLYQTGMRRMELITLKEKEVDLYRNMITVYGKRAKERAIPIGEQMKGLIQNYIAEKQNISNANNDFLLILKSGKPLYENYVYRVVQSYLKEVTTLNKKSPHVMRHTFATHLSNNGAEISAIKDLLGHSSLAATQIYTHNNIEQLKKVYQKAHPKAAKD